MIKRCIILATFLIMGITVCGNEKVEEWQCSKPIQVTGEHQYKQIQLDEAVYQNSKNDLSDLRVVNEQGEFVAYYIDKGKVYTQTESMVHILSQVDRFKKKSDTCYDYSVDGATELNQKTGNGLLIKSPNKNIAKEIQVFGSYDANEWEHIATKVVYQVENTQDMKIDFTKDCKYLYYRLKVIGDDQNFSVDEVNLLKEETEEIKQKYSKQITLPYKITEASKKTIIEIENTQRLKLSEIKLDIEGVFEREYQVDCAEGENTYPLGQGTLCRLKFQGIDVEDTTIYFDDTIQNEIIRIAINNQDDKPLEIKAVKAHYLVDYLVIDAKAYKKLKLLYGNDEAAYAAYDIQKHKEYISGEPKDSLTLGEEQVIQIAPKKEKVNFKWIYNVITLVVCIILSIIIMKKLKGATTD